jgi:hypothetical protein
VLRGAKQLMHGMQKMWPRLNQPVVSLNGIILSKAKCTHRKVSNGLGLLSLRNTLSSPSPEVKPGKLVQHAKGR